MKTLPSNIAFRLAAITASVAALCVPPAAMAALTDIANEPVTQVGTNPVKPNVMFILDDSGSMARVYVPDDASANTGRNCFKNAVYNPLYYNPAVTYFPPKAADGTSFPDLTFTAALENGYDTSSVAHNLSTNFKADRNLGSSGSDTAQTAYYYNYIGTTPAAPVDGTCYADASYAKVTITALSLATVKTNFANWYGYYRARMLTMKTAVGSAFSRLDDRYRVGFDRISYTGTDPTDSRFLNIGDFDATQKTAWFNKLYSTPPSGFTPLRSSLSKTGRMYAGKIGTDPVQYSCQQNFAFLSTDGFWNATAGYKEDGATAVGQQDGPGTDRPYFDGQQNVTTTKTVTTATTYLYAKFNCSGSQKRIQKTVTTTTRTVVKDATSGAVISDTSPSSAVTSYTTNCSGSTQTVPANTSVTDAPIVTASTIGGASDTLSDVSMYYYKTDLRPGVPDSAACKTGATLSDGTKADVCKDNVNTSNNDKATYQHMTTFTMGLGVNGQLSYAENYESGGSADYNQIVAGTKNWPVPVGDTLTAVDDLWHAAVNARGTYFSARNPTSVSNSLLKFFSSIQTKLAAGAAAATSNLEPVAGDNFAYVANYRTVFWDGDVKARTIDLTTGLIDAAIIWSGRDQLALKVGTLTDSRAIYTYSGTGSTLLKTFVPANFTAAEKTAWFNPVDLSQYVSLTTTQKLSATSDNLINYLRGQKGFEASAGNLADSQVFRAREFALGDIVNGKPVYVRLPPFNYEDTGYANFKGSNAIKARVGVVYIAANDGMLHAFDSASGNEKWAYVPGAVIPNLRRLADSNYAANHRFFADGSPSTGDIASSTNNWRTILVAGLNAGGRGYYALDITDPDNPKGLWEFTNTNLGLSFGNPVITKLQSGRWVVIVSSGYNNVLPGDGVGRIFILDANTGALIDEIKTAAGDTTTPSGLGKLTAWTVNGLKNNTADRVYGGDLLGNVWRFDINDILPPTGKDAFLLATLNNGTTPQAITTRLEVGEFGGRALIYAGTGILLSRNDPLNVSQQSLYAIYDKLDTIGVGNPRTNTTCPFVVQTISTLSAVSRTLTQNAVDFTSKCGWYVDLNPGDASRGERINVDMILQLGVLSVVTNVPEVSACTAGGTSWIYFINAETGGRIDDIAGQYIGNSLSVGQVVYRLPDGKVVSTVTTADDRQLTRETPEPPGGGSGGGKRIYWRELFTR